ncbi:hypothetical protein BKA70DRAFT_1440331 [Coprinopsis sp. MPI-PUGE-AT-0042]|nr:hypothetical protein BKA70DRAFT_1440331 [Coprinopsis sp. MPI-PUGE-AT-0042]
MVHRASLVLLFISLLSLVLAAPLPSDPPSNNSPPRPGQWRAVKPAESENRHKPDVFIVDPNKRNHNKGFHPGLVLDKPDANTGLTPISVVTKNLRGSKGRPIASVVPNTTLKGFISTKNPMTFEPQHCKEKWRNPGDGCLQPDVSPKTLQRFKSSLGTFSVRCEGIPTGRRKSCRSKVSNSCRVDVQVAASLTRRTGEGGIVESKECAQLHTRLANPFDCAAARPVTPPPPRAGGSKRPASGSPEGSEKAKGKKRA